MINVYDYQAQANIQCLLDDIEYSERKDTLFKIFDDFKKENIRWSLACSTNLFLRGIVDDFHDLDLIVDKNDVAKIMLIMENNNAILKETGGNGYCESDIYRHYQFGRVDVDIISVFRLVTFGTYFEYAYNSEEIDYISLDGKKFPLVSMEALYLLYSMMEGWQAKRRYKRVLIEEYLLREEIKYPNILKESLNANLPGWIKRNVRDILNK